MPEPAPSTDRAPGSELLVRVPADGRGPDPGRGGGRGGGRAARTRAAIVDAATRVFLAHGYTDAATDRIAAEAGVSKQTVYNQFGDKERLFAAIVTGVTATAERFAAALPGSLDAVGRPEDLDGALTALARSYLATATRPDVLAVRRLVTGEAHRFPELAAAYWDRAPARVLAGLAALFAELGARGLLAVEEPDVAAEQFAYLVLGRGLDHGVLHVPAAPRPDAEVARTADRAVATFLAAYRPRPEWPPGTGGRGQA